MKNTLLLFAILFVLTGCSENYRRQCIQEEFKDCELFSFPESTTRFLVRQPDGTILVVNCDYPLSGKSTSHSVAFYAKKN